MKIDPFVLGMSLVWGSIIGLFYFGGLWWTIRGIARRQNPELFFGLSFLVRTLITLLGFWLVVEQGLAALLMAVCAFTGIRLILAHQLGVVKENEK